MKRIKSVLTSARAPWWLALLLIPLAVAACNGGSGGNGY
jgi:hypothetical protein